MTARPFLLPAVLKPDAGDQDRRLLLPHLKKPN